MNKHGVEFNLFQGILNDFDARFSVNQGDDRGILFH